jgi:hypothetical protein
VWAPAAAGPVAAAASSTARMIRVDEVICFLG